MTERSPARGLFVTGTDTGVGKTLVSCALARGIAARGIRVGVMKPIETGVGPDGPLDAQALREAAGSDEPLDQVCPVQLSLPAAPTVAAKAEGRAISIDGIRSAMTQLRLRHEFLIVEGAGGLLVPVVDGLTMADLAAETGFPLLIVARSALGTINHTLLTLEAARLRGLPIAGVVISHGSGVLSEADAANLAALRDDLGTLLVGEIPPLGAGERPAQGAIDLDRLLAQAEA